jgi:hypothetical protein
VKSSAKAAQLQKQFNIISIIARLRDSGNLFIGFGAHRFEKSLYKNFEDEVYVKAPL